eukprot:s857_g2.t1
MKRNGGPLGPIPGLLWDEQRQRYFSAPPSRQGAATAEPSEAVAAAETAPRKVAELPVAPAVARTLDTFQKKRRTEAPQPEQALGQSDSTSSDASQICAVCLEAFEDRQKLLRLPCQHLFHDSCLQPWMESRGSCPKCRSAIDAALDVAQKAAQERWEDQ